MSSDSLEGWDLVIGLEVHCELDTNTKLFCGCPNSFGDSPNTNVCPVCLGLPGSLPVLNSRAVDLAMRIGAALHCDIRPSRFHRKNYFYPDMPKAFQISQYDAPINCDGWLELTTGKRVGIERAHIEEDTGKTTHLGESGRIQGASSSLVDYNRAGVPLVETVSAPDMNSAQEAKDYVSELRAILVACGASDGKMEEGSLRVDANVSVRRSGSKELGTRCEIKNVNSLKSLGKAIEFEAARQIAVLQQGGTIRQETRHFNEDTGETSSMRSKEDSHDYRYFPEPDLVVISPDEAWIGGIRSGLPPMPAERRALLGSKCGAGSPGTPSSNQVSTVVAHGLDALVLGALDDGADPRIALSRCANEAVARVDAALHLAPTSFSRLVTMESVGDITATQSKLVLGEMLDEVDQKLEELGGSTGGFGGYFEVDPEAIANSKGFEKLDNTTLARTLDDIVESNPGEWERFLAGDEKVAQFFVGQMMKSTRGQADGKAVISLMNARRDKKG